MHGWYMPPFNRATWAHLVGLQRQATGQGGVRSLAPFAWKPAGTLFAHTREMGYFLRRAFYGGKTPETNGFKAG